MSKKLQKSLQDYLSKIKTSSPNIQFSSTSFSYSKKRILRGCKHPKTLSFAVNCDKTSNGANNNDDSATLSDVDRFLFENFRSLYIKDDEENNIYERRCNVREDDEDHHHQVIKSPVFGGINFNIESPRFVDLPPDLCGSNRFFVATGFSSSLIEEARLSADATNTTMSMSEDRGSTSTSTSTTANGSNSSYGGGCGGGSGVKSTSIPNDCIAVLRYSPSPYDDFRRSMQEMVEARLRNDQSTTTIDWDFMEELLFCYLKLNDKKSYKFILSAFVDLVVVLRRREGERGRM